MRVMKWCAILVLVAVAAASMPPTGWAAPALQGENLLVNPGFEQPYSDKGEASSWARWFEDSGAKADNYDYVLRPDFASEMVTAVLIHGGSASQHVGRRYDPWHAGMKQSVNVPAGSQVRFCAYARLYASNEDFEKGVSSSEHQGRAQVGIFPNGDAEWNTGGIIWSAEANPHGAWQQVCVDATVGAAGRVTAFTSNNYRGYAAFHLDAWWDDASLVVIGGTPTAAPTTVGNVPAGQPPVTVPPSAPIVCETRPDGSVVRVTQTGDSLFGIAIACDSTVDEIKRLNNLASDTINVGVTLIVKGPTAPPTAAPAPTTAPEVAPTQAAAPTPAPASTETEVCVEAFNDANANQVKDDGEQLLGGVGFTLSDAVGPKSTYVTSGLEAVPYCFGGLTPGAYTVQARAPNGVNSTTDSQWQFGLAAGTPHKIAYGGTRSALPTGSPAAASPGAPAATGDTGSSQTSGSSSLGRIALGGLGVLILLVAGFMAGLVVMRARR